MSSHYLAQNTSTRETSQDRKVFGREDDQVYNRASGVSFQIDKWDRLDRFLVLGNEGGTYYATEQELTRENAQCVFECAHEDGQRLVERVVEISKSGRAPNNDPAIFALAVACSVDDANTRRAALDALSDVCRIGTHLFHFAEFVELFRGWGRGLRDAIARWYQSRGDDQIIHQAVKYQARDGWSHRDLLRLSHPVPQTELQDSIFGWICDYRHQNPEVLTETEDHRSLSHMEKSYPSLRGTFVEGFLRAKEASSVDDITRLITEFGLTREMVPSHFLDKPQVWDALLDTGMPMHALIRNLGNMAKAGLLTPMGSRTLEVADQITDKKALSKARVHPIQILSALMIYQSGSGHLGGNSWNVAPEIVDALDEAFYLAFENVEPSGKRHYLGLDISGSMRAHDILGLPFLSPRDATAAMAMVTTAIEPYTYSAGFHSERNGPGARSNMEPFPLSTRERLDDVIKRMDRMPFGGTDCSLPMLDALEQGIEADVFVVYTDNETWAGRMHPYQALQKYRNETGIPAKLVSVGMAATDVSIADPRDAGMLDIAGFDAAAPRIISDFASA